MQTLEIHLMSETQSLVIEHIGLAIGELLGPLSLPQDEEFPSRRRLVAAEVADGNPYLAALVHAAGLEHADFEADDFAGVLSVLEAAVVIIERLALVAG